MPELTRRRYPERPDCWHVYYGDVQIGTIARRVGCPIDVDQWEWICGFYPGMGPGQHRDGTAETFEAGRADFEDAWKRILPTKTEAYFQEWRDDRDARAEMRAMRDRGELMPSQVPSSMVGCPCGARFDSHRLEHNLIHVPHITEHQALEARRHTSVR
jgi:hypothetical protein